jgi:8-hydroxy-5-deazaflavin:NADPH oxidoreductase
MRIGVLGTGTVGTTLAGKLRELGHEVRMGSRDGSKGDGTFAEVAAHGELLLNCTAGVASLAALEQAGEDNLRGKVLIDVANPLDFSGGFPPRLSVCNDDSLAEQIQRRFPEARVVKALNTVGAPVMVEPGIVPASTRSSSPATMRRPRSKPSGCWRASGGPASACSTSAGLSPAEGWRCTCRSGSHSSAGTARRS